MIYTTLCIRIGSEDICTAFVYISEAEVNITQGTRLCEADAEARKGTWNFSIFGAEFILTLLYICIGG